MVVAKGGGRFNEVVFDKRSPHSLTPVLMSLQADNGGNFHVAPTSILAIPDKEMLVLEKNNQIFVMTKKEEIVKKFENTTPTAQGIKICKMKEV